MSLSLLPIRLLFEHDAVGLSSSPLIGPEPAIANSLMRGGNLPKPSLSTIADIERAVKTVARIPALKERICEYIQSDVSRLRLGRSPNLTLLSHGYRTT